MEEIERDRLLKNVEHVFLKIGFDQNFLKASNKHVNVIQHYFFKRENIQTRKELCMTFLSKLFIDKIDMYPCKKKNICQVDKPFDSNFKTCPSELFGEEKWTDAFRISCFFDCLNDADILECRVVEVLDQEYRLRVVDKYESPRLLCDLNITVSLPRNKLQTSLLKDPLLINEFVRVVVENDFATVDELKLPESKKNVSLGRIKETELPFYVLHPPSECGTLFEYIKTQPEFPSMSSVDFALSCSGLDTKKIHSYYHVLDSNKDRNEPTGQVMFKEAQSKDVENFINLSLAEQKNNNYEKALEAITEAIKISKSSKLYIIRASMYAELEKPRFSKKSLLDLEVAYQLDKSNQYVRQTLSYALSTAAIKFYKSKIYPKAVAAAEKALSLDSENKNAADLLTYVKKYYPESSYKNKPSGNVSDNHVDLTKVKREIVGEQEENISVVNE